MTFSSSKHFLRNIMLGLTFLGALQPVAATSSTPSFSSRVSNYVSNFTPGMWLGFAGLALCALYLQFLKRDKQQLQEENTKLKKENKIFEKFYLEYLNIKHGSLNREQLIRATTGKSKTSRRNST